MEMDRHITRSGVACGKPTHKGLAVKVSSSIQARHEYRTNNEHKAVVEGTRYFVCYRLHWNATTAPSVSALVLLFMVRRRICVRKTTVVPVLFESCHCLSPYAMQVADILPTQSCITNCNVVDNTFLPVNA
jgi:hypothetical protein